MTGKKFDEVPKETDEEDDLAISRLGWNESMEKARKACSKTDDIVQLASSVQTLRETVNKVNARFADSHTRIDGLTQLATDTEAASQKRFQSLEARFIAMEKFFETLGSLNGDAPGNVVTTPKNSSGRWLFPSSPKMRS